MRVLYYAEEDSRGEIAVAATPEEWREVLLDLEEMASQIKYYLSRRDQHGDVEGGHYGLEPATSRLIQTLGGAV